MGDIVTAKELAKCLKLRVTTIQRLASQGKLPGTKVGGSWRFDMDDISLRSEERKIEEGPDLSFWGGEMSMINCLPFTPFPPKNKKSG